MAKYTPCPKCKHKKTVLMSSLGPTTFHPHQEPYASGQLKELNFEVDIIDIGLHHCRKCKHSFGIWIEEA